jgi:hypothetical protein
MISTPAYYVTATVTAVISFIVQAVGRKGENLFFCLLHLVQPDWFKETSIKDVFG